MPCTQTVNHLNGWAIGPATKIVVRITLYGLEQWVMRHWLETIPSNHDNFSDPSRIMMTSSNGNISALLAIFVGNSPVTVNSPHKGQWRGALKFSLICAWINGWLNNREAGDLRRHRAHYDVNNNEWLCLSRHYCSTQLCLDPGLQCWDCTPTALIKPMTL